MSEHTNNRDHHPHVLPLSVYFGVGGALFVLTGVTVAVSYVDLGATLNLIVALLVATVKGSLVALFFMHLLYDNKLYAFGFCVSLIMLTVFIVITMFDTLRRDGIYEHRAPPITAEAQIYEDMEARAEARAHDDHGHSDH